MKFGAGVAVVAISGLTFANAQSHGHMVHGGGMHLHDEVTMPGLLGENASPEESAELALMFRKFDTITREVENLPDGIRTVTRSTDQEVMDALVSHSVGMIDRVGQKDDPKIRIQSPTLDVFFLHGDEIQSVVEMTDDGLVVIQTSENPELVAALQTHAAEVTDMADRGMAAVHDMMMEQGRGH
ncbi:MAG: hypothetical protein ABJC80_02215 [Tateyamaria sp.]